MATATKNRIATNGQADAGTVHLPPLRRMQITMRIVGITAMIHHKWSEKAKKQMRDKHAGKKTREREVRDPEQEAVDATYRLEDGRYGFPAGALKKCVLNAAHKDIGIARTMVMKSLFVKCHDNRNLIAMECDEPEIVEDTVTVGNNSTDLRYRPYFYNWAAVVTFEIDLEWLGVQDLINLVERAGFGVGLMEWRPEKGGEFGRFQIDPDYKMKMEEVKPFAV